MATLTVYPVPNTTVSGTVENGGTNNWATVRGATDGTGVQKDPNSAVVEARIGAGNYYISRGFFLFDTSALTSGATISSAVLSLCSTADGAYANQDTTSLQIVSSTPAANNNLVVGDYDQVGTTSFGSINLASWTTTNGTYNNITLNASGIAAISKTGVTKLGCVIGRDFSNQAPTGINQLYFYFSGQSGTSKDPKLVITYSVDTPMTASQGSFTLTGKDVGFLRGLKFAIGQGTLTLTGKAVGLFRGYGVSLAQGAFTLTGKTANLIANRILSLAQGSYTLSGQTATFIKGYAMSALRGLFTLTGFDTAKFTNWIRDTKPTSTYTNDTKTTSTFTKDTKPTSSWTNDTK